MRKTWDGIFSIRWGMGDFKKWGGGDDFEIGGLMPLYGLCNITKNQEFELLTYYVTLKI